jgi:uncharacterized protein YwqG
MLTGSIAKLRASLESIAAAHLPVEMRAPWVDLIRPAVRLLPATSDDDVVIATLGGDPVVPDEFAWPVWDGHGPLGFVGEIDLAALARSGLDTGMPLPDTGRLLCFYYDGVEVEDYDGVVTYTDRTTLEGVRLVHLAAAREACDVRAAPSDAACYRQRTLTGRQMLTAPSWRHLVLQQAFGHDYTSLDSPDHPLNQDDFLEQLAQLQGRRPWHQIGGYADPQQHDVEKEAAHLALDLGNDHRDPQRSVEALHWRPLLQIDHDDDPGWGDTGTLYWLVRDSDILEGRLDNVLFTWQCT